jgi:uncharacterized repeat protein (TIGR03847 family)
MAEEPIDFGLADRLEANAVGQPGQRTFHLLVDSQGEIALLWLEKEQLNALGEAIEQVLAQIGERGVPPADPPLSAGVAIAASVEFQIGQLAIGYDHDRKRFLFIAHRSETDPEGPPTFTCQSTPAQARRLSHQIIAVVNAGRPRCRLCNQPINPEGHICPGSNGHLPTTLESSE